MEFCQYGNYPTGCESVALYMLLQFYKADVTVDRIYDLLPMGAQPFDTESGVRYGGNPEREFVGDPRKRSPTAFSMRRWPASRSRSGPE